MESIDIEQKEFPNAAGALSQLAKVGWVISESVEDNVYQSVKRISSFLGRLVPLRSATEAVTVLRPTDREHGHPNSLTARFGQGSFPWHTDTAHWAKPARYVVLGCIDPGSGKRPTHLLPWRAVHLRDAEFEQLRRAMFLVRRRKLSFLDGIIGEYQPFVRIDFECMIPKNREAVKSKALLQSEFERAPHATIEWQKGMVLIVDNWQVLHARGLAKQTDRDRQLLRALVEV